MITFHHIASQTLWSKINEFNIYTYAGFRFYMQANLTSMLSIHASIMISLGLLICIWLNMSLNRQSSMIDPLYLKFNGEHGFRYFIQSILGYFCRKESYQLTMINMWTEQITSHKSQSVWTCTSHKLVNSGWLCTEVGRSQSNDSLHTAWSQTQLKSNCQRAGAAGITLLLR